MSHQQSLTDKSQQGLLPGVEFGSSFFVGCLATAVGYVCAFAKPGILFFIHLLGNMKSCPSSEQQHSQDIHVAHSTTHSARL